MILTEEQALLKGREQFEQLLALVQQANQDEPRIDTVERELMQQLLALGHTLLSLFVARQGDGDLGQTVPTDEGRTLNRLPEKHDRRYVSIFGELIVSRFVYGSREGRKIERVPLYAVNPLSEPKSADLQIPPQRNQGGVFKNSRKTSI